MLIEGLSSEDLSHEMHPNVPPEGMNSVTAIVPKSIPAVHYTVK